MVARVLVRTRRATLVTRAVVATDDQRIYDAVAPVGNVVMTRPDHASGSDRVAEVAEASDEALVVNVQGDLPLLNPAWIDAIVTRLLNDSTVDIATPAVRIRSRAELEDPNAVKVVADRRGHALYFSRAPVPCHRDDAGSFEGALHHIGIYAYRRDALFRFASAPPTPLETTEKLEQLRALENGIGIGVVVVEDQPPLEVDTQADLDRARIAALRDDATGSR